MREVEEPYDPDLDAFSQTLALDTVLATGQDGGPKEGAELRDRDSSAGSSGAARAAGNKSSRDPLSADRELLAELEKILGHRLDDPT